MLQCQSKLYRYSLDLETFKRFDVAVHIFTCYTVHMLPYISYLLQYMYFLNILWWRSCMLQCQSIPYRYGLETFKRFDVTVHVFICYSTYVTVHIFYSIYILAKCPMMAVMHATMSKYTVQVWFGNLQKAWCYSTYLHMLQYISLYISFTVHILSKYPMVAVMHHATVSKYTVQIWFGNLQKVWCYSTWDIRNNNGRFPLLRIMNTTTSMLFGHVMELSIKYPQSIIWSYSAKTIRGTGYFLAKAGVMYKIGCSVTRQVQQFPALAKRCKFLVQLSTLATLNEEFWLIV